MNNKELIQAFTHAFSKADIDQMEALMTDDIVFNWPGSFQIGPGKKAVRDFFAICPEIIDSKSGFIIEEKNTVAATGEVTTIDDDGTLRKSFFNDIYTIEDSKVKRIDSYVVFAKESQQPFDE